jgi:hypothetical protein
VSGFFERLVRPCPDCKGSGCKEFGSRTCVAGRNDGPCCPDCVGGWGDLDATEHPLAAWPIPGDTVLHGSWLLTLRTVDEDDWAECDDSAPLGMLYSDQLTGLARVVTPADEARRAALHPSFAYPLEGAT